MITEEKMDCCGCGICEVVCPINAIEKSYDELGSIHYTPGTNCIHCGKCSKMCPMSTKNVSKQSEKYYKARAINKKTMLDSSSGGVAHEVALHSIKSGGVVYGAAWNAEKQRVEHCRVESIQQLSRLQGSKYVQSFIGPSIYSQIVEDVKKRFVVFIGTPCQVSAIKNLTNDYSNLFTIDLICHGVPSASLFHHQLEALTKEPVRDVSFRNGFEFRLKIADGAKIIEESGLDNPYYSLFLHFATLRESCYSCPYANQSRSGDITVGDYNENGDRYSLVIINTDKGETVINKTKNSVNYEPANTEIVRSNHAYIQPTLRPKEATLFRDMYPKYGLYKTYRRLFWKLIIKRKIRKALGDERYYSILGRNKRK